MNYPTTNCVEETVNKKSITENNSLKVMLDDTQKALVEAREMLMKIHTNIINVPSPDNDKPMANCMNDQAIINRNLAMMCRDLAVELMRMLFGEDSTGK